MIEVTGRMAGHEDLAAGKCERRDGERGRRDGGRAEKRNGARHRHGTKAPTGTAWARPRDSTLAGAGEKRGWGGGEEGGRIRFLSPETVKYFPPAAFINRPIVKGRLFLISYPD